MHRSGCATSWPPQSAATAGFTIAPMPAAERIAGWMRRYLSSSGARGFVVGLSGGLDSAVVARLAQLAAPGAVIGLLLPCHSDPKDEQDAVLVARQFSLPTARIDISSAYDAMAAEGQVALDRLRPQLRAGAAPPPIPDDPRARIPNANIKPRLRDGALLRRQQHAVPRCRHRQQVSGDRLLHEYDGGASAAAARTAVKSECAAREPDPVIHRADAGAGLWWYGQRGRLQCADPSVPKTREAGSASIRKRH